jgi:NAD(P)-dependent dehydrogenase (short-subunit alcohol dehydrogenase family)
MRKTVVITGAGSGVGRELCKYFAKKNWNTIGFVRATQHSIPDVLYLGINICDPKSVAETFSAIKRLHHKSIDVLINCAGVYQRKDFRDCTPEQIDRIIDTNVKGTMYCTLEALKMMNYDCRVINIGSVSGVKGIAQEAIYSASKHAINGFSDSLNKEGIKVTTINPGGIDTPLWNEKTPYPGDVKKLLSVSDIVSAVDMVVNAPSNVILKKIDLHPDCEVH